MNPVAPRRESRATGSGIVGAATAYIPADLAARNAALVPYTVTRLFPRLSDQDREEMIGVGFLALTEAANQYDSGHASGAGFSHFACQHIRWRLLGAFALMQAGAFALPSMVGRRVPLDKLPRTISLEAPLKAGSTGGGSGGDAGGEGGETLTAASILQDDPDSRPETAVLRRLGIRQFWDRVAAALPEREAQVIRLCYLGENEGEPLSFRQVGARLGISGQRVQQIHASAINTLHWKLWLLVRENPDELPA